MIQEEYVALETAKLLKEAGFPQDEKYYARYNHLGQDWHMGDGYNFVLKPSQSVAMRWLREEKYISVEPGVAPSEQWCVYVWLFKAFEDIADVDRYPTYEAAAEAGIQAACKYLIEHKEEQI